MAAFSAVSALTTAAQAWNRDPLRPEAAEGHYRQGLALAEEQGMHPLAACCHAGLARLYAKTSTREQAYAHLATATAMYREMGMTHWLEKLEGDLKPPR